MEWICLYKECEKIEGRKYLPSTFDRPGKTLSYYWEKVYNGFYYAFFWNYGEMLPKFLDNARATQYLVVLAAILNSTKNYQYGMV